MQAQILNSEFSIPYSSSKIVAKDKNGYFVMQKLKGDLTGTGLYKFKNGSIYIGDFKDKKPNGYGMLICSENDSIKHCPEAKVYVGKFKDGIKRGKGVCYNSYGEMIYSGKFENDQPTNYFSYENVGTKFFSDTKSEDFYYIGEFEENAPNGYGAIFFTNGDILISNFKEGKRTGINIFLERDGNWLSENVEDNSSTFISSSREYASYVAGSKSEWNAGWKKALGSLEDWAAALNDLSSQLNSISTNSDIASPTYSNNTISNKQTSQKGNNTPGGGYDLSEQRAYNRDKSTYSKYDGMLAAAFAGNRDASASEIKSWQNKMRQIRQKWESKGRDFPHFPNEDK